MGFDGPSPDSSEGHGLLSREKIIVLFYNMAQTGAVQAMLDEWREELGACHACNIEKRFHSILTYNRKKLESTFPS